MSFDAPSPAPRVRPSTVSLAVNLMFAAAALELINIILTALYAGKIAEASKKALEGTSQAGTNPNVSTLIGIVVGVIILALLVVLAIFVGKGVQIARILTWVLGGLALCCTLSTFGLSALGEAGWNEARKTDPDLPTWQEYNNQIYSAVPGWYQPVTTIIGILMVVAILVAIILLALPASHPFFRAQKQEWEPPIPGAPGGGDDLPPPPPPAGPAP
ncbi:hypothetical protein KZZ52_59760 [Dactylosporangium sp. AC04546]|uniref:hypothetical protein n=1 Tax=Dactylosporangium sp. AC04546 TaxID=2862460 RepID=UPI001EDD1280|nr:hypothetical protein [Dactylosporangium sp. AC04546]WVK83815.1 hypothetical protein KZZ52_59760 [Dactylosporangium sp. AC04546]